MKKTEEELDFSDTPLELSEKVDYSEFVPNEQS